MTNLTAKPYTPEQLARVHAAAQKRGLEAIEEVLKLQAEGLEPGPYLDLNRALQAAAEDLWCQGCPKAVVASPGEDRCAACEEGRLEALAIAREERRAEGR